MTAKEWAEQQCDRWGLFGFRRTPFFIDTIADLYGERDRDEKARRLVADRKLIGSGRAPSVSELVDAMTLEPSALPPGVSIPDSFTSG
jgi:hypothetical protein